MLLAAGEQKPKTAAATTFLRSTASRSRSRSSHVPPIHRQPQQPRSSNPPPAAAATFLQSTASRSSHVPPIHRQPQQPRSSDPPPAAAATFLRSTASRSSHVPPIHRQSQPQPQQPRTNRRSSNPPPPSKKRTAAAAAAAASASAAQSESNTLAAAAAVASDKANSVTMPPRSVLSLQLAFRAMDAVRGRRKATISYITAEGVRKQITLSPYTADPDGYEGPEVLECIRPDHLNKKKKPEMEHESEPEPEPEPEPEQLHLYVTNTANKKVAHIPTGEEGDQYLLDFVMGTLEELEANGKDGLSELSLQACVDKVGEHFDVLDENRLEPIWKHALNKLTSLKIESLSETNDELLRMIEEDRENFYSNANRVTHVEERVDDVEEQVDDIKEEVDDIKTRLERVELHLSSGSLFSMPPAMVSSMPEGLQRHWRAAREQELDPNEVDKIRQYTDSEGFSVINPALRDHAANGTVLPLAIRRWKSTLESGLRKIENYVGTVYRGSNMDADWIEEIKGKFNNRTRGVRVRVPFCDAAFLSASTKLHSSFNDTNCRFVIRSKSGKEIAAYSIHPFEYEVLFAPDTKFIIHDVVVLDSGKLLVRMRED